MASTAPAPPPPAAEALPHALLRAGMIAPARYLEAVGIVREDGFWRRWGLAALLALAVGQLLAGIEFFFAFNWDGLPAYARLGRSEEHTSELQSLMRISYAVFCLKKK